MKHAERFNGRKFGLILCGGNIEPLVLAEIIERGMVKSGRLARLRFDVRDVPGALADVATLLGKLGANIDEVHHQRAFTTLAAASFSGVPSPTPVVASICAFTAFRPAPPVIPKAGTCPVPATLMPAI